jgi:hypothetical protein
MKEKITIVMGANQPSEIWQGINKDEKTIKRFELLMKMAGLSETQIETIKAQK